MAYPLDGIRVLDLSTEIAGPYATKLLADAGADVVKIEAPGGDPLRRWSASGAAIAAGEDGALFRFLHTSKRSAVLDCTTEDGRSRLLALARSADLVFESFSPGVIEALGLGPEALWRANPALSLISISSFGRGGPWSDRPATEFTLQAWCGSTASRGTPDRPPIAVGGRLGEWMAASFAAFAALAALEQSRGSGQGEHVDLSVLEAMCLTMAPNQALYESMAGRPSPLSRSLEIPSIEPAKDGFVGFCTITAQQWRDFLVLVERPELIDDAELASYFGRAARVGEVNAFIRAWTREHSIAEMVERASRLRIPVAPIGNGRSVVGFDHFVARGTFVANPGGGFQQPRPPYRMSRAELRPLAPAPRLGEHSAAILTEADAARRHETHGREPSDRGAATAGLVAPARLPLAGLRVVDFTAFWAGPFATHLLCTLGAEVIKVESIQHPDGMRFASVKPPSEDRWWEWGPLFQATNLGKRGLTLDLNRPRGQELARRLIAGADAVVENFSPRVMGNLGLEYEELARANPRLIMVRMPAFGLDGPWRDRVGFAQTMEQISGMAWITGFPDGPPVIPRGPCDPLAGMHAAFALLVALEHRRRTGVGQLVEVTMVEAALNAAAELVIEASAHGALLVRDGNHGPVASPQNLYACRGEDEWVALAVVNDDHWRALVAALGVPAWARDPALAQAAARRARQVEIDRELARWFADRERDPVVELLLERGIPAAPVTGARMADRNPQMLARGFFQPLDHPVVGKHLHAGLPMRFARREHPWYAAPTPTLGEHNARLLGELLGLSDEELAELGASGIIGERPANL